MVATHASICLVRSIQFPVGRRVGKSYALVLVCGTVQLFLPLLYSLCVSLSWQCEAVFWCKDLVMV